MTVYNGPVAMPNVNDLRAIVQGVEQAEARGDHVTAERLLRQALALQETSAGPNHPEVANILNNLAIVCELNGKLTDAEGCYRRAYAIATSSLPATDPFVTTSRENLEQFCSARGIPLKDASPNEPFFKEPKETPSASSVPPPRPAPPPLPTPKTPPAAPRKAAAPPSPRSAAPPSLDDFPLRSPSAVPVAAKTLSAPAAIREPSRVPAIAAVLALLGVLFVVGWYLINSNSSRARVASVPSATPSATSTPAPSPAPAEPTPAPQPEPPAPATAAATPPAEPERVAPPPPAPTAPEPTVPERPAASTTKAAVTALTAEVCSSLTRTGAWSCAPATNAQAPGVMYFYTRVASPRDTTIEHRWYRGGKLEQRVPLRIRANPSGFRTYSQTRMSAASTGTWKVELRAEDGQLIDEKTFAVR
jgi:hypothetical protein